MKEHARKISHLPKVIVALALLCSAPVYAQTQEHVHHMAHSVMPFDISKTVHIFKMTEVGGVMRVIAKDPGAADQVALIQQHLHHEAMQFKKGDFSDPAKLHGTDMPGLMELQKGAQNIKVTYRDLPAGAEIAFETSEIRLVTAVHRWFGAQLSEHGSDARSE